MLNGQNFVIDLGDGVDKYGFYTTRYVEANTKSAAEDIAVESIKSRTDILKSIKNEKNDPPMLYAEEIEEVDNIKSSEHELGLAWFKEAF